MLEDKKKKKGRKKNCCMPGKMMEQKVRGERAYATKGQNCVSGKNSTGKFDWFFAIYKYL